MKLSIILFGLFLLWSIAEINGSGKQKEKENKKTRRGEKPKTKLGKVRANFPGAKQGYVVKFYGVDPRAPLVATDNTEAKNFIHILDNRNLAEKIKISADTKGATNGMAQQKKDLLHVDNQGGMKEGTSNIQAQFGGHKNGKSLATVITDTNVARNQPGYVVDALWHSKTLGQNVHITVGSDSEPEKPLGYNPNKGTKRNGGHAHRDDIGNRGM